MKGRDWVGVGAVSWCRAFAALHVYWALGGSAGLASSAGTDFATRRPASFVAFGLWGVAALLLIGAIVTGFAASFRFPARVGRILGWLIGAAGLALFARGVLVEFLLLADVGGVRTEVGPEQTRWSHLLWNPWFIAGGVLLFWAGIRVVKGSKQVTAQGSDQN